MPKQIPRQIQLGLQGGVDQDGERLRGPDPPDVAPVRLLSCLSCLPSAMTHWARKARPKDTKLWVMSFNIACYVGVAKHLKTIRGFFASLQEFTSKAA